MQRLGTLPHVAAALFAGLLLSAAPPAQAGCGCDHPPPAWAPVMPPFASPGKEIRIWGDGFHFQPGRSYEVAFENGHRSSAVASATGFLDVKVPPGVPPGPVQLDVEGPGVSHQYDQAHFTVLSPAPLVPGAEGVFSYVQFVGSVDKSGTLLIPFNLSHVADATQFAIALRGLPLRYEADDVVFYNADGVDLTLFTLQVDDPTERQWGSYYGWQVEQDSGIHGEVFENKTSRLDLFSLSDLLHYWRHEFHTYKQAHQPGGSHEVGPDGYHVADGSLHIDHDHLVLAIDGRVDGNTLSDGALSFDVFVGALHAQNPVEPADMQGEVLRSLLLGKFGFMIMESPSAYGDHDDDDD